MNTAAEVFLQWLARLSADQECANRVKGPIEFRLQGSGGGNWIVQGGAAPAVEGPGMPVAQRVGPPTCVVTMDVQDFVAMANGSLNPQLAYLTGRVSVEGEFDHALSLAPLIG